MTAEAETVPVFELLTDTEAAPRIGVAVSTLRQWRVMDPPRGPRFVRIGSRIYYRPADLIRFVERNVISTDDDPMDPTANVRPMRRPSGSR